MLINNAIPLPKDLELIVRSSSRLGRQKNRIFNVNEDYRHLDRKNNLYIVADGMGGHGNGDEASRLAVQTVTNRLSTLFLGLREGIYSENHIENKIKESIEYANSEVILPVSRLSRALKNIGTTLSLLFYYNGHAYISNVGDSGIYLFRNDELNCLTEADRVKTEIEGLSADEVHLKLMKAGLSQYLGKEGIEVRTKKIAVQADDVILLATDGLTDVVHDTEMTEILSSNPYDKISQKLVYRANYPQKIPKLYAEYNDKSLNEAKKELGGKDNITLILLKFKGGETNCIN
jgi:protein phosphatase